MDIYIIIAGTLMAIATGETVIFFTLLIVLAIYIKRYVISTAIQSIDVKHILYTTFYITSNYALNVYQIKLLICNRPLKSYIHFQETKKGFITFR